MSLLLLHRQINKISIFNKLVSKLSSRMSEVTQNDRRWWHDAKYQAELTAKAETGCWFIKPGDELVGKVVRIVYSGYKIQLPDGTTSIVNPDQNSNCLVDLTPDQYMEEEAMWWSHKAAHAKILQEVEDARLAIVFRQSQCLHEETSTEKVAAAAGCDIYDVTCDACAKILRRSWATAYDKDPDDRISDWNWLVRESNKLYGLSPNKSNYVIVESIQ